MSISTKIYLSARYKSSKPGGSRSERAFFEGCWAFTQKAADAGNNKRPNENVQSWPIELRSKQPYCGDVPPFGVYCGKFTTAEGEKFKDSVSLEFTANHDNSTILTVSGEGQNLFGLFRLNGTYCITTRVMTCTKTYGALKRSRPADILPHFNFSRPTNSIGRKKENVKDKKNSKKSKKSKKSLSDPRTFNFNIRLFKPVLKDIIAQLKMSEEHHLASHMERYQPLDKHQRARVLSIFTSNPRAQQEVTTSGKPREKVFRGFLARYDMKLQSSLIPDSHFRKLFRTLRSIKKNYKGNNLQHRVAIELKKAAHDCGIASLSSYRLEYRKRQKRHNARRDAESAAPLSAASMAKAGNPPLLEHLVDHSWKQRVNRAKYIERIWITMKKYQPRHTDLMTRAEKIEHDIIGRAKTEVKYIRAVVEWTELFSKQANDLERKQFGLYKRVFKLLEYYDNTRPTDLRLMSWDTDVAELKHLMQRVKVDLHVASSYRRMRDLFFKYKEVYTELKRTTTATEFEFDRGCVGMCAEIGETPGAIRYVGETPFGEGTWIGMELDTPTGNSNGIALGYDGQPTKYFSCRAHHGMFVHTGKEKLVLPSIRATDARRFVTLLLCFQRRSNATATAKGQWTPRFARNVHSLMHAFAMSDVCVLRVTEYVASRHPRGEQPAMVRQHFFKTFCNMKFEYVYTACKALDRSKRYSMTRFFQWTGANSPPNTFPIGHTNLKHLRTTPSNLSSKTIKGIFGWQGDLLMLSFSSPARVRRKKPNIGQFVTGDIQPVHHPRNFLATMGATPGASFAFVADVIGPAERAAIRNVVDAAYLRYVDRVANQSTPGVAREVETDFKLKLSPEELRRLLGRATLDRVHALVNATACRHSDGNNRDATNKTGINIQFNTGSNLGSNASNTTRHSSSAMNCEHQSNHAIPDYNNILVRRCAARGRCIPWHVDVTNWVCQVTLNDDYEGGDLTYLLEDGVRCPRRPAGSATVHGGALGRVMHAVTQLRGGVRYGLFLFKTDQM